MVKSRCLVLGGSGFIGTHLCEALALQGCTVRAFSRRRPPPWPLPAAARIKWQPGDFGNPREVRAAVQGCDVVYHLISSTTPGSSNHSPHDDAQDHILPT